MWKLVKEIKSREGELHFKRWRIIETPWFNIYVHRIYKSDEDKDPHNHPWWFLNLILWGSYSEEFMDLRKHTSTYIMRPKLKRVRKRGFLSLAFNSLYVFHKLTLIKGPVTSLVITGPHTGRWGYWCRIRDKMHHYCGEDGFLTDKEYREQKYGLELGLKRYE